MLQVEVSRNGSSTLLRCVGRLVAGRELDALKAVACAQNSPQLLLDLSSATEIDARGLGTLTTIQRWAAKAGTRFAVLNPSAQVRRMMSLTRLDTAIPVTQEAWCAVAS
jgi:anti-anti-sigma factor